MDKQTNRTATVTLSGMRTEG